MDELEQKLHQILSDPQELERIGRLAAGLFGAQSEDTPPSATDAAPEALRALLSGGGESDKAGLVRALSPYLRPERQRRLQRALRLAHGLRAALSLMETMGGVQDV